MKKSVKAIKTQWLYVLLLIFINQFTFAQDLVWSEEFEGAGIDKDIWTYTTGGDGNGNGELQYYTASSDNAYIEDGNLVIEAKREQYEGNEFTSARLHTNGRLSFRFGTIEARIKLPDVANGLWPAFWMMGTNFGLDGWPYCGEFDIMEVGFKQAIDEGRVNRSVSSAMHWWHEDGDWGDWLGANYSHDTTIAENFYEDYHTFKLEWTPDAVKCFVDDSKYYEMNIGEDANLSELSANPAFIILNLAVGGFNFVELPEVSDITAPFPGKMFVDYVRLYGNDYTELYNSNELLIRGDFGVSTEARLVENELNWGDRTNLYIWNNMETIDTDPYEGTGCLSYTIAPGAWWGMGLLHKDYDMKAYTNGYLHFMCKTTSTTKFGVGIGSTAADGAAIDFVSGGEEYGLVRDGEWHEVILPLNKFGNVDFRTINAFFYVYGDDPGVQMDIAFDDIYWSESIQLEAPQQGSYGVYTETPENMNAGNFTFGVNGDLYIWDNTMNVVETPAYEGNSSLQFESNGAGWFGLAFTARNPVNLTSFRFDDSYFNFSMKTSSTTSFKIGLKGGNVDDIGQKWFVFNNGSDPYGFVRDGQWHNISIPMSEIRDDLELFEVSQLFELVGAGEISDIAFDNIYFSNGQDALDPGWIGDPIQYAPTAVIKTDVKGGGSPLSVNFDGSASYDLNSDALTYAWDFGDGATANGATALHIYSTEGIYSATLTVTDTTGLSGSTAVLIVVDPNYGITRSWKRGLGYGYHSVADMEAISPGVSWWYNWSIEPDAGVANVYQDMGMEFVPMAWNGGYNEAALRAYLDTDPGAEYILAFNEPNFLYQANMTPSEVAAAWPQLEAIADDYGLKIISPALNYCGECNEEDGVVFYSPFDYFDQFFDECSDCRVDGLAIHSYMGTVGALEWYVGEFKQYGLPIWLTEFANWENDPTLEQQKEFLVQSVDYLENDPDVERYAWFTGRHNGAPYIGLFDYRTSGVLTELGELYVNMPVHDASVYYNVPGRVEAENYATMSGVRPQQTQDVDGFLNMAYIEAGDWMDYHINAEGGDYSINLRVASDSVNTHIVSVLIDGAVAASLSFNETGDWQNWTDISGSISVPAGQHTLRLRIDQGSFNINWFSIGNDPVDQNPVAVINTTPAITTGTAPFAVTFNGASSYDPDGDAIVSYQWDFGDGNTATGANVSHTYTTEGTYTASLTVLANSKYGQASTEVQVIPDDDLPPIAQFVYSMTSGADGVVDFDASNSYDPDGDVIDTYSWNFGDGTTGAGQNTGHTYADAGTYTVTLTVSNALSGSTSQEVIISFINENIALWKPASTSSQEGAYAPENAVDEDANTRWGSAYETPSWIKIDLLETYSINRVVLNWERACAESYQILVSDVDSDPVNNAGDWTVIATMTGMEDAARIDELSGLSGSGRYIAMVGTNKLHPWGYSLWEFEVYGIADGYNEAPIANAGSDQNLAVNAVSATLDGSLSYDPDNQPQAITYQWTTTSGASIANATSAITDINGLSYGQSYVFTLVVNDGNKNSIADQVTINVANNQAPVANAGNDISLSYAQSSTTLDGSASYDPDNFRDALTYQWSQVSGGTATIASANAARTSISGLSAGTYTFALVVFDGIDYSTADNVIVSVEDNLPPVFSCSEIYVDANGTCISLDASSVYDPEGDPLTFVWTMNGYQLSTQAVETLCDLSSGTYPVTLVVTDPQGRQGSCSYTVTLGNTECGTTNLALNKPAVASSQEGGWDPAQAVDNNMGTRWSSLGTDDEWIRIDLEDTYSICEVQLSWETAYGSAYNILLGSTIDIASATTIASITNSDGGEDIVSTNESAAGRYIWIQGITRATGWGYSLYEIEVYGKGAVTPVLTSIEINPVVDMFLGESQTLSATAYDQFGSVMDGVVINWTADNCTDCIVNGVFTPTTIGESVVTATSGSVSDYVYINVDALPNVNLALNKPAISSSEQAGVPTEQANDGNYGSRWSSEWLDNQWWQVDLQAEYNISAVNIYWENAYGKVYDIQISNDPAFATYQTLYSEAYSDGSKDSLPITVANSGRYLRMNGITRATGWGFSMFEFEAYGVATLKSAESFADAKLEGSLSIYPNPVDNYLTLQWENEIEQGTIKIVDLSGKLVYQENVYQVFETTISVDQLVPGSYMLIYTSESAVDYELFIKE